jgi:hypothetical protein
MFVKDIVERDAPPPTAPRPPVAQSRGFPIAGHRSSGSAFARSRKDAKVRAAGGLTVGEGRVVDAVPVVGSSAPAPPAPLAEDERAAVALPALTEAEQIRRQVHAENLARVQAMSGAERETEAAELKERFGDDIVEVMRKRRAVRDAGTRDAAARAGPRLIKSERGMGVFEGGAVERPQRGARGEEEVLSAGGGAAGGLGGLGGMGGMGERGGELDAGERAQNAARVAGMSAAERDDEMRDLEERFGAALLGRLKSTLQKRAGPSGPTTSQQEAKPGELLYSRSADTSHQARS